MALGSILFGAKRSAIISTVFLSSVFALIASSMLAIGVIGSAGSVSIRDEGYKSPLKFAAISIAASHQEIDIYFTAKLFDKPNNQFLPGLVAPTVDGGEEFKALLPLKFQTTHPNYFIKTEPYLSASGLLADVAYTYKSVLDVLGLSPNTSLVSIYVINLFFNILFIFFLCLFLFKRCRRKIVAVIIFSLVLSPWIILDSLSLMMSPFIRFGGIFALCLFDAFKMRLNKPWIFQLLFIVGILLSSLNGFEFFFFDLAISLLMIRVIFPELSSRSIVNKFFYSSSIGIFSSIITWFGLVFKITNDVTESLRIILFTFFKHSFMRSEKVPSGAVGSGDAHLPFYKGVIRLLSDMSLYLPYPMPSTALEILGISAHQIQVMTTLTSLIPILLVMFVFMRNVSYRNFILLGFSLFCTVGIAVNSYIYNHAHHMPPVLIMLALTLSTFQRRELSLK
jgi:hypothetical protein